MLNVKKMLKSVLQKLATHDQKLSSHETIKVLATSASYMNSNQTINLSENVSNQSHGIVLVWSAYESGAAQNYNWYYQFVPKWQVTAHNGQGVEVVMQSNIIATNVICRKYVYIYNDRIVGNANNVSTGTGYANNTKVLRAVLGV